MTGKDSIDKRQKTNERSQVQLDDSERRLQDKIARKEKRLEEAEEARDEWRRQCTEKTVEDLPGRLRKEIRAMQHSFLLIQRAEAQKSFQ